MAIALSNPFEVGHLGDERISHQGGADVVGKLRGKSKGLQSIQNPARRVSNGGDVRSPVGSKATVLADGSAQVGHLNPLHCMGSAYAEEGKLSLPTRDRVLSQAPTEGTIAQRLSAVFRSRAVKVLANTADTCQGAVKQWRAGSSLPSVAALIRLMAADDEIYQAVMELAGRGNSAPVDMMLERLQADLAELKAFARGKTADASRAARAAAGRLSGNRRMGDGPGERRAERA